jgi:hypothetical protein
LIKVNAKKRQGLRGGTEDCADGAATNSDIQGFIFHSERLT